MAEKSGCPTLDSSIRSEDLLSDMELLPATPAQPGTPFSSEVTTQLYASLRRSRQAEAHARSHLDSQPSPGRAQHPRSRDLEPPEPDMERLAEEMSRTLSAGVEASAHRKGGADSYHISEMERVRCHLQSMLQGAREAAHAPDPCRTSPPLAPSLA
uniref:Uncharacterized protein n=1 Tax=Sphenodon punctatus TaxID=8508 RepID=A0A8D0HMI5_SPHPU